MTHPHPDPVTVSNLRPHRRQRTLAVILVFAGTVGCVSESPVSPTPQEAVPSREMKVPTSAAFLLNYLTPYDAAVVEIQNMNTEISAEIVYYWGAGTLTPPDPTPLPSVGSLSTPTKGKPGVSVMYIPPGGCSKEYIDCVYECLYLREVEWRMYYAEFLRAEDEFWDNVKTGKSYLNNLWNGPQDKMYNNFYQMRQVYTKFKNLTCKRYIG
jgi:hypothetical protein